VSTVTIKVVIQDDASGTVLERSDITKDIEALGLAGAVKAAMGEAVAKCANAFAVSHLKVLRKEYDALEVDALKAEMIAKVQEEIAPIWAEYDRRLLALNGEFRDAGAKRRLIKETIGELEKGERQRSARL
jgi:hypothetical protein